MKAPLTSIVGIAAAVLLIAGCNSLSRDAGFSDVSRSIATRTGRNIHWNQGTAEDEAVAAKVRAMLQKELTVDEAIEIALLNNHDLQATYEELGIAQSSMVQAGLLTNPILSGNYKFGINGPGPEVELSLAQNFLELLYIPLRKSVAESQFDAARMRVTGAVLDVVAQARSQFYKVQAEEQTLEMRRQVVDATAASYEAAKRLREAGNITDSHLDNERDLYEQARLDLALAEVMLAEQREKLTVLMGLWGTDTDWTAAHRLPEIPSDEIPTETLEKQAITQSVDLAYMRKQIEVSARMTGLTKASALVPDLSLGPAGKREASGEWLLGPSFTLPIPLFDQGQARVAKAQAEYRRDCERYYQAAVQVRSAARVGRSRLLAARARALHYRHVILPLRGRVVDEAQLEFNAMEIGVFQLVEVKQRQIESGRQYIEALRDYWLARAEVDRILSGRSPGMSGTVTSGVGSDIANPASQGGH